MTQYSQGRSCHKMVADTAKAMAAEAISKMLNDNEAYGAARVKWPDFSKEEIEATLLQETWPHLVEQARATLARLLATPLDELLKEQISSALILDNTLAGRKRSGGSRLGV